MITVIVLGSGTPNPDIGRAGAAVAVVCPDGNWVLVDAGRAATQRAIDAGLDLGRLAVVCLTHHHSDHVSDLATLAITRWVSGAVDPLRVVAPDGPSARFAQRCLDVYDDSSFHAQSDGRGGPRPLITVDAFDPTAVPAEVWALSGVVITCALVDHHPVAPAVGYRIECPTGSVAVSGDTAVCAGIELLAQRVDVLVHETVLEARASAATLAWNAGAVSVGRLAVAAAVGTLVLTHLLPAPTSIAHEQSFVDEVRSGGWSGPTIVAHDLLRLTVG